MDLANRETLDLLNEIKYFTKAHTVHQCEKDLTLFIQGKLGTAIPLLAWELIQRGALERVKVLIEQSEEPSHSWVCNSAGYQFTN